MNIDQLIESIRISSKRISPDDLAYLFATGKSELEFRNLIALQMHDSKKSSEVIAREWHRHDLTVLENNKPKVIVEGKSWIHFDAASEAKLKNGNFSIRTGMLNDLKKMHQTQLKYPDVECFASVILFSVDVEKTLKVPLLNAQVTYSNKHKRGSEKYGSTAELVRIGNENLMEMFSEYGSIKQFTIESGRYLGMKVYTNFFLMKPNELMPSL